MRLLCRPGCSHILLGCKTVSTIIAGLRGKGSNLRHPGPEPGVLPLNYPSLAGEVGIEPTTKALTVPRSAAELLATGLSGFETCCCPPSAFHYMRCGVVVHVLLGGVHTIHVVQGRIRSLMGNRNVMGG